MEKAVGWLLLLLRRNWGKMQEYKGNLRGDEGGVTFKVYVFKSDLLILLKNIF